MSNKTLAIICPPDLPIPPYKGYGGIQRSAYDFITELNLQDNYRIILFAPGDSKVNHLNKVTLSTNLDKAIWGELVENTNYNNRTEKSICEKAKENEKLQKEYIDFICCEIDRLSPYAIITMYDNLYLLNRINDKRISDRLICSFRNTPSEQLKDFVNNHQDIITVALSKEHKEDFGNPANMRVIEWGLNIDNYDFLEQMLSVSEECPNTEILREWKKRQTDYLLILSEVGIHKGQATAIQIAKKSNCNLIIAGTPQDKLTLKKTTYLRNEVVKNISDKIIYFGNADEKAKIDLMRFSKAFIAPFGFEFNKWKEPFGRAMVESMACGTPVVAFRHGSPISIVKEGISGYLFDTIDDAVDKVKMVNSINRFSVRKYAENKYDIKRVVNEYESILEKIKY